ncbi:hypothetical protein [Jatrophihabitans endophyticus]|uniref:hypothetical protein n=1 Tax=Jatrophihabitans endophyticus TaxID=1206085 RepID=UPI0019E8D121|nr:hypothetical protein [Jatrophihabitans endophyticus]MBE7190439.1 hypothetical protein [Jatrophihabitans endophyticus]
MLLAWVDGADVDTAGRLELPEYEALTGASAVEGPFVADPEPVHALSPSRAAAPAPIVISARNRSERSGRDMGT